MPAQEIIEEVFERDEQRRMQKVNAAKSSFTPPTRNLAPPKRSETGENASLTAEEQIVREAIFDVIDGPPKPTGDWAKWEFFEDTYDDSIPRVTEEEANEQRLDFANAVVARIRTLKTIDRV